MDELALVRYRTASQGSDMEAILALQRKNMPARLPPEEALAEGFLFVEHERPVLEALNHPFPHILAWAEDLLAGYALVMLRETSDLIPVLQPMFAQMDSIKLPEAALKDTRYFVMGQICIAREFRKKGIFEGLYTHLCTQMRPHFDFIVTEIALQNQRSIRAHTRFGFQMLRKYQADGINWAIVGYDLRSEAPTEPG